MLSNIKEFGPPKMGLNVLMGKDTKEKILNAFNHFDRGDLQLWSGFAFKINRLKFNFLNKFTK